MIIEISMRPFPAVRTNGKGGRFTPKAMEYHNKCKELRKHLLPHSDEIIRNMIAGTYHIQFFFKMADSWTNKKRLEMNNKPHQIKPDNDNCFKAVTDTLFYGKEQNDCEIWSNSYSKHWGEENKIIIILD